MPVKYNIVQRPNPRAPLEPRKYYPSLNSSGRVSTREVAVMAAQRSTLSTMDVMAAIESFLAIIPEQLGKGNVVELGDFGSFWLRAETNGAATEEEVTIGQIEGIMPRFKPGKEFKKVLGGVEFVRLQKPPVAQPPE